MKIYLLLFLFLFVQACSISDEVTQTTRIYSVSYSNSSAIDTITATDSVIIFGVQKRRITLLSHRKDTLTKSSLERNYFSSKSTAQFLPPVGGILDNTTMLPPPKVELPIKIGDSLFSEHTTSKKHIGAEIPIEGWNIVTEKVLNPTGLQTDSVWKITSINKHDKKVEGTYYYSDKQGFVKFEYRFDTVMVNIALLEVKYKVQEQ